MNEPVYLSDAIEFSAGGPPSEFRVLASGVNATTKGPVVFGATSWASIQKRQKERGYGLRLPFDRNQDFGAAAGWFTLAMRDGELWATEIEWTPKAKQELADKEYRYFSPALFRNWESGEVEEIVNISLTNTPATNGLKPLMNSRMNADTLAKYSVASESELFARLDALILSEASLKKGAIELNTQVTALTAKLAAFEAAAKKAEKDALIARLSSEGRLPPALRAWADSQSVEVLTSFGEAAPANPSVASEPTKAPTPAAAPSALTDEERKICKQLRLSEKDYLEQKAISIKTGNYLSLEAE